MGRPRKPVLLHKMDGTFRKDRHALRVSIPPERLGAPPEWLDIDAVEEWKRLTDHPVYGELLSKPHRGALIEYCVLFSRMVRDAKGMLFVRSIEGGKVVEIEYRMTASERQTLNSLRMQLGLTPASQSKLTQAPETQPTGNRFAALRTA